MLGLHHKVITLRRHDWLLSRLPFAIRGIAGAFAVAFDTRQTASVARQGTIDLGLDAGTAFVDLIVTVCL